MKKTNILIIDDIEIIGDCIVKRILKSNDLYEEDQRLNPYFINIDLSDINSSIKKIESLIITKSIDILILDRGFYNVIDPKINKEFEYLNSDCLYCYTNEEGENIEELLKLISKDSLKNLKGIIVYTYDSDEYMEPAFLKQKFLDLLPLPKNFTIKDIKIVLTYSEIYRLSNLDLYIDEPIKENNELIILGKKSDFMLYGLFMGEILYHRTQEIINSKVHFEYKNKKNKIIRNIFLIFIIFSSINVGANTLFSILKEHSIGNETLLIILIFFGFFLPLLIIYFKPNWFIEINED